MEEVNDPEKVRREQEWARQRRSEHAQFIQDESDRERERRELHLAERAEDVQERNHHREEQSTLDASWGGVNLAVRGSIVVLAMLALSGMAFNAWTTNTIERHLHQQDDTVVDIMKGMQEIKGTFMMQHQSLIGEIERNRYYLREIERVCILTSPQREQLQKTLPPSLKELLQQDLNNK